VYVTGRSTRTTPSAEGVPGTLEDTVEAIERAGGIGVPVRCDHADGAEVRALFERVRRDHGRVDLLVSNAWGGYEHHDLAAFVKPFWEQDLEQRWAGMFEAGLRAHLAAARHAAPIMIEQGRGLVVSTVAWDRGLYLGNLFYDVAKAATVRAISGMARELRPHGVAAVALAPGFMRTERVMAAHAQQPFDLSPTESPRYLGRAVVALAADPDVMRWTGEALHVGALAQEYGFTDEDGRRPPPFRLDEHGAG
jgi:NAD(P)-dependent dehydrogenase (short-subunit alcohol dehydrogenase family)